nr:L,D-transpeptidase family protein [Chloroflexota bacterium]
MLRKWCFLALALLVVVGCSLDPGNPGHSPTLSMQPTATVEPSPLPSPTFTATLTPSPTPTMTLTPSPIPTLGPEASFERFILIDQDTQTMYVYEDGVKIRTIPVSTGNPEDKTTMTPAWEGEVGKYVGTFFSFGTWADDAWYLFDHYGAVLIHGAPYLKENGEKIYQDLDALGVRPVSHGCIRLPPEEAKWFSEWGPQGAHIIILPLTKRP